MSSDSLFPALVESERLRYEPLYDVVDTLDIYEYHRTGEMDAVMAPLGEAVHATRKKTFDEVTTAEEQWESAKRATYAISRRADDEFVGVAELWFEWEKRRVSFGTWIREPFWGRGYSGERAGAMLYVVFDVLDVAVVAVGHEPDNDQSKRAIQKYVERYGGQHDAVLRNRLPPGDTGGPRDLSIYSISQEQWRERVTDDEVSSIAVRQ
ncbi:Protein N-acetyltransferase, RimJ/RimL family [Halogranum rubrum]|uniref:Protein N-acetyltransferase, RimJ/RimL family n=1 Tax=Halogranum rubrum TaxID=553466 RepID=A0A1I4CJ75_9EURY|nr:GNAT family protein [Halogranum rubrum]SFK80680.1 Protein N-acetyltransferase, RimJ/RimL family [Halogranum rubrum]